MAFIIMNLGFVLQYIIMCSQLDEFQGNTFYIFLNIYLFVVKIQVIFTSIENAVHRARVCVSVFFVLNCIN